jgi:thiol-disulfide isomerase/thioredoxin
MTAAGPSANLPPHMLLEFDLRLEIAPLLGLALILAACDRQSEPAPQPKAEDSAAAPAAPQMPEQAAEVGVVDRTKAGRPMPDISFEAPNGDSVKLADFAGQPILVNLWATWCGPCVAEMPMLDALAKREASRMQVIVISQDMKGRPAVDRWWKDQTFAKIKPYLDQKADMSFSYGGGTLPTTVMYDQNGKEVWRVSGAVNWTGPDGTALVEEALDGVEGT